MLVLARPHQGRPAALILGVEELPGHVLLVEDGLGARKVAVLCRQVETCHTIVSLQD